MPLCDTHCHLDVEPLAGCLPEVLARARAAGVERIVAPAYDLASWSKVAALRQHPGVSVAYGLHPWVAVEPLERAALAAQLDQGAAAIGEIGLDSKIEAADLSRQGEVLRLQLDLAHERDLPVILHCRGWHEELLALLEPYAPRLRGVVHAFSRGPELAERFLGLGLFVAFGGAATRRNASRVKKAVARVPLERMLLETDAPSIGLEGILAEHAEPCHVAEVARAVAALKGVAPEVVAEATYANAQHLFRFG